ncbi:SDR family NAD(P)-dependent oxidoreductase, partial [Streptomyces flavofungini]|uniref:SDR family NAD(P)-dependent oxidoreductase n=1 Tax=Streptomyces flavofungini TaxID=68200 RepID=UPI0034DFB6ED
RYWVPAADRGAVSGPARLHPLLDANESTVDEIRFRRTFLAAEPLVRDHVIEGRALLAGAVCLEMARAAAGLAGLDDALRVRDVLWGRPVVIEEGRPVDVYVGLTRTGTGPGRPGDGLAFTVYTARGAERTVHVRGTVYARPAGPAAGADLDALRASCPEVRGGAAVRAAYDRARFAYGPSFDVIEEARFGDGRALLTLALPETPTGAPAEPDSGSSLPPALLDGALRACHWAAPTSPEESGSLAVPFNLGALEIRAPHGRLPRRCHAYAAPARHADAASGLRQFDVRVLDDSGAELVRIDNFGGRHLTPESDARPPARDAAPFFYEQVWQDKQLVAGAASGADAVLVLGDGDSDGDAVVRGLAERGGGRRVIDVRAASEFARTGPDRYTVDSVRPGDFERLLADLRRDGVRSLDVVHLWGLTAEPVGYGREGASAEASAALDGAFARGLHSLRSLALAVDAVRLTGRVRCAYVLADAGMGPRPDQEAVAGFALSLTGVLPRFELFTVVRADGPGRSGPAGSASLPDLLAAELAQGGRPAGAEIRYAAAGRQVRALRRADATGTEATVPLKHGGTYLITGGTGGIGLELARHLASAYRARLVLISRSADGRPAREAAEGLVALGAEVLLAAADTADAAGMRGAVARAKERFGHLDGVFHLAGAADQCSLLEADAARFTGLLSVKAHGVRLLDALTADEPLDLFVVFSSIASVVGDFGACAYAAANRFLDSYADGRERRVRQGLASGRTLSLAWPLWRIGGVDALMGEEERTGYRHRTGMREFTGDEGLRALDLAWRTGRVRLVPAVGEPDTVDAALLPRTRGTGAVSAPSAPSATVEASTASAASAAASARTETTPAAGQAPTPAPPSSTACAPTSVTCSVVCSGLTPGASTTTPPWTPTAWTPCS